MQTENRTHDQVLTDAKEWALAQTKAAEASRSAPSVGSRGTNGYCELLRIPKESFDVVRGFPHEIMHLFLNLGGQIWSILRETDIHTTPYATMNSAYAAGRTRFINNLEADLIADAMKEITFPSAYHRIPRPEPKEWSDYKSSEYMFLILVIFPFIFQKREDSVDEILPQDVRKVLLTLSYAMHHLLCDRYDPGSDPTQVLEKRATIAQRLVNDFVHQSTRLFGESNVTYAFHQLQHLPKNYLDFGPAYAWSAFGWESLIGVAKRMQHGTNKAQQELTNKIVNSQAIRTLLSKDRSLEEIKGLGLPQPLSSLSARARTALDKMLSTRGLAEYDGLHVYKRLLFRKFFTAETVDAKRTSRHSDSIFRISTGQLVAFTNFVRVEKHPETHFFAIGDVLTGCNVRTHMPVVWKEAGVADATALNLELPKFYRHISSSVPLTTVVSVDHIDVPVFVLLKPSNSLAQYSLPSLTVMPKD